MCNARKDVFKCKKTVDCNACFNVFCKTNSDKIKLLNGTKVEFDIGQGLDKGCAVIIAGKKDIDDPDIYLYRLDVYIGSLAFMHRDTTGELWVNDFEVKEVQYQEIQCDFDDCNYFDQDKYYDKCCDCSRNDTSDKDDALDHYESE